MSQGNTVKHPKADFRDPVAGCHYSIGGLALVNDHIVMIIEGHPVTESGKHIGAVPSIQNVQMLGLETLERAARTYAETRSENNIFSCSEDALKQHTSHGYVCYQALRQLIRIQQKEADIINYGQKIDVPAMTELIKDAIASTSMVRSAEHRGIPLAQNYVLQRYGLWRSASEKEPALEAA